MILRRLYLYLVSAAALGTLAAGLSALGFPALMFAFNDPNRESSRGALAGASAATLVALVVWAVHFWFARRYAHRDPAERVSAIRRLYVYWACLVMSIGAAVALDNAVAGYLRRRDARVHCIRAGSAVRRCTLLLPEPRSASLPLDRFGAPLIVRGAGSSA